MPAERRENVREISRQQMAEICAVITEKIKTGAWKSGDKLPTESQMVEDFGVARNTVRKALNSLESRGLITRQVGRGTFVSHDEKPAAPEFSTVSPADIMEARIALEPAIARDAVLRASAQDISNARECLKKLASAKNFNEHEAHDAQLHQIIVNASRNELYKKFFADINELRRGKEWKGLKKASLSKGILAAYHREHAGIVEAFVERDGEVLADRLRKHLIHVRRNLFDELA